MISKSKIWRDVSSDLIRRITGGEFALNSKFLSLNEISAQYGVSDITSRRVAAELGNAGYIESVPGSGSYVKCRLAERNIVFLSEKAMEFGDSFLPRIESEIYKGVVMECGRRGADVQVMSGKYLKNWPESKDLLLIIRGELKADDDLLKVLSRPNCKKVFCHTAEAVAGEVSVRIPYKKAMSLAVSHLLKKGHRRIAFMSSSLRMRHISLRFDGYYETLKKHGVPLDLSLVKELPDLSPETDRAAVRELLSLPAPPTALVTANNTRALNVLEYCQFAGIKVPDQLAIASFDNIPETVMVSPRLTVVNTFWDRIGSASVRLLLEMADHGGGSFGDVIIQPELIVREST
jgi:DNA-binding LacI/PurR family transcriptional regulator